MNTFNSRLAAHQANQYAQFQNALDEETEKQGRIELFVDEILGGQPVISRINLKRVTLTYCNVEEKMNEMLEDGALDSKKANIDLMRFCFGDKGPDIDLLQEYKANVRRAAFELIGEHYIRIEEEIVYGNVA